jgi:hypothetical protein
VARSRALSYGAAFALIVLVGFRFFSAAPRGGSAPAAAPGASADPSASSAPAPTGSAPAVPTPVPSGYATPAACDDASFVALEATHPSGYTEVTVCGPVTQVLPERTTRSGLHKYFYVRVDAAGDTIEIVTNIDETGDFAVNVGDDATVHGRYYYDNASSQGIDWTHHNDPGASWPYPGYVQIDGGPFVS